MDVDLDVVVDFEEYTLIECESAGLVGCSSGIDRELRAGCVRGWGSSRIIVRAPHDARAFCTCLTDQPAKAYHKVAVPTNTGSEERSKKSSLNTRRRHIRVVARPIGKEYWSWLQHGWVLALAASHVLPPRRPARGPFVAKSLMYCSTACGRSITIENVSSRSWRAPAHGMH